MNWRTWYSDEGWARNERITGMTASSVVMVLVSASVPTHRKRAAFGSGSKRLRTRTSCTENGSGRASAGPSAKRFLHAGGTRMDRAGTHAPVDPRGGPGDRWNRDPHPRGRPRRPRAHHRRPADRPRRSEHLERLTVRLHIPKYRHSGAGT